MTQKLMHLGCLLLLISHDLVVSAEGSLKHDPFIKPPLKVIEVNKTLESAVEEVPWTPRLTSIMLAGKRSLITLDGVVMKIGEEKDGYRLVQVSDHEAMFVKGAKRITLQMESMPGAPSQNATQTSP